MDAEKCPRNGTRTSRSSRSHKEEAEWEQKLQVALKRKVSGIWTSDRQKNTLVSCMEPVYSCLPTVTLRGLIETCLAYVRDGYDRKYHDLYYDANEAWLDDQLSTLGRTHGDRLASILEAMKNQKLEDDLKYLSQSASLRYNSRIVVGTENRNFTRLTVGFQLRPLATPVPDFEPFTVADRKTQEKFLDRTRRGIVALNMYLRRGVTLRAAAEAAHLSPNQLKWYLRLLRNGTLRRRLQQPLPTAAKRRTSVYDSRVLQFLYEMTRLKEGKVTLRQLEANCSEAFPGEKTPNYATIGRYLKAMGLKKKAVAHVPPGRNSELNKKRRGYYMAALLISLDEGRKIIFIDETGLGCHLESNCHYAPAGQRWCQRQTPLVSPNVTCLLAVSQYGMEAVLFIQGACDSVLFLYFMQQLVDNLHEFKNREKCTRPVIVCDNVAFHHSSLFKAFAFAKELEVLYTPSYSPMMNCVEYANLFVKRQLAKLQLESNGEIPAKTVGILLQADGDTYKGFVNRTLRYAAKCLQLEDICE